MKTLIFLKANDELKKVFLSLIKTVKMNIVWNHIFVITNNTLILPGEVRSLFFDYDNKRIYTNLIELTIKENQVTDIVNDKLLVNTLNMTLYVFGKWGEIKGIKVEEDYAKLNRLFQNILKDIEVEPSFRDDNFRFYKKKILISYEDVIQEILDLSNPEQKKEEEDLKEEEILEEDSKSRWKSSDSIEEEEYKLGLWHNMRWITREYSFLKTERMKEDINSRLGNNFYPVDYICPMCQEKLYLCVYPVGKEVLVDTDEGHVYLARVYTCNHCNNFYTPRPEKLLQEGDIYSVEFEEDRTAYEDYLELLGNAGEKCANYKFNEYEAQRKKKKENEPETLEEVCEHIDSMSEEELDEIEDKIYSGFYPKEEVETYYPKIVKKKKKKNLLKKKEKPAVHDEKKEEKEKGQEAKGKERQQRNPSEKSVHSHKPVNLKQDFSVKTPEELKDLLSTLSETSEENKEKEEAVKKIKEQLSQKLTEKYNAHIAITARMSPKQLKDLKAKIEAEDGLSIEEKKPYLEKVNQALYEGQEKLWRQKAEDCKGKSYQEINRVIEEIEEADMPDSVKETISKPLLEQRKKRGEKEVESLMSKLSPQLNKQQFQQILERLHQYKEVDISPYEKQLKQQRGLVEQQEIKAFIAPVNKRSRNSLMQLYNDLKEQGFQEESVAPYLEKIHDKIYEMDEAAIKRICPDFMEVSFEDGLKAVEEIKKGAFLPELKINALEMLDKRLTKLKVDECEQLMRKLKREITEHVSDISRFHFYEARKAMRGDIEEDEKRLIESALNSYAFGRNQYEYPILISDSSRFSNGKEGFILTPDHIFYKGFLHSGIISIIDIKEVEERNKLMNKGVFIEKENEEKIKLPLSLSSKEWKEFAKVINDFIHYLQEKPESRSIAYLAKEKHEKICCYRCGYIYTEGDVCPKCGSKANR